MESHRLSLVRTPHHKNISHKSVLVVERKLLRM